MEEKLKQIFGRLFGIEAQSINEESSPKTIKKWDSLAHMNLVVSIEDEFGVQFSDEEIPHLVDFGTVLKVLAEKIH
jgi:acyl carrier protein